MKCLKIEFIDGTEIDLSDDMYDILEIFIWITTETKNNIESFERKDNTNKYKDFILNKLHIKCAYRYEA